MNDVEIEIIMVFLIFIFLRIFIEFIFTVIEICYYIKNEKGGN